MFIVLLLGRGSLYRDDDYADKGPGAAGAGCFGAFGLGYAAFQWACGRGYALDPYAAGTGHIHGLGYKPARQVRLTLEPVDGQSSGLR